MFKIKNIMRRSKAKNKEKDLDESFVIQKGLSDKESNLIAPPSLIERMPGQDKVSDYWIEVGDNTGGARYIRSWYLKLKGRTTWVGMLDSIMLSEGDGEVDVTVAVEPKEVNIVMNELANRIAILQAETVTEKNAAKLGNIYQELSDLNGQMSRLRVNAEKLFNTSITMNVAASNPEKMRRLGRTIIKRLGAVGVKFNAADTKQLDTWRHTIGIGDRSTMQGTFNEMETSNVADFFLFGYGGLSHRNGVLLGFDHYNRPVFYDGWDRRLNNQHMVVFGRAGSGKSFSIKILTRRSAARGIKTAIVDPDREYKNLVMAMGGAYAELSPKEANHHRINVYEVEEEEDENGRINVNLEEAKKGIHAFIFKIIRIIDPNLLDGSAQVAIHDTTNQLFANFGITTDPQSLYEYSPDNEVVKRPAPTLYDHYKLMMSHPDLQKIHQIIKMFTREGGDPSKAIFDGPSTFSFNQESVIGISVADLDEEWMKPLGIFVATKWIWERFAKKNRAQKKRVIVDEAQEMMKESEEAKWLENAYRRGRKLNVSMCAVTQGFEVFLRVPEGMGILKNAPTKLLLRQESIDIEAVQGKFALAEGEARFLITAPAGVGILKVDEESTIVRMQPTENEYWLYTTNPNDYSDYQKGA